MLHDLMFLKPEIIFSPYLTVVYLSVIPVILGIVILLSSEAGNVQKGKTLKLKSIYPRDSSKCPPHTFNRKTPARFLNKETYPDMCNVCAKKSTYIDLWACNNCPTTRCQACKYEP